MAIRTITDHAPDLACHYYQNGLYCSEALLRAFNEIYDLGLPDNGYKMATGFGSGMAETGCACGAVTSCVMVLGLVAGRTHSGESEAEVFDAVKVLHAEFKAAYKSACCRVLTKQLEWGSKAHVAQCENIVKTAATITERLIENELKAYTSQGGKKAIPKKMSLKTLKRKILWTCQSSYRSHQMSA